MATIKVKQGQTLFDIAVQHTGSVENTFAIALLNNLSITSVLTIGQVLQVPAPTKKGVVALFTDEHIPATYTTIPESIVNGQPTGIGNMIIEQTFTIAP